MNWNDLKFFITLVDAETLTAAAISLNVEHTTVARRIECLEDSLDIKLFNRLGKRYSLTFEGKNLYQLAKEIQQNIQTFERQALETFSLQGEVRISAPSVLANEILVPKIAQFYQTYPAITIKIIGESKLTDLYKNHADIALRLIKPTENDFVSRHLTNLDYHLYAHQDVSFINNHATPNFIEFTGNPKLTKWSVKIIESIRASVVFSSNDLYMIKTSIANGLGIGVLPSFMVNASDSLTKLTPKNDKMIQWYNPIPEYSQEISLYLVMHQDVRHARKVRAVADWVIDIFKS